MPEHRPIEAAILVIDQSTGTMRWSGAGTLLGIDLAAGVSEALDALRTAGVRVGLAAPRDGAGPPWARSGNPPVDLPVWEVRGTPRDWLAPCVADLGSPAAVFVSGDLAFRDTAHALGFRVAPHAIVAAWIAANRDPLFVRIEADREILTGTGDLLPYFVERGSRGTIIWGIVPADALAGLARPGISLEVLRIDPGLADPYLLKLDEGPRTAARASFEPLSIVAVEGGSALLAVPPSGSGAVEQIAARRHGAFRAPIPSIALLQPWKSSWAAARIPTAGVRAPEPKPAGASASSFAGPTSAAVQFDVARYSGASPIDAAGTIASRHVRHPHATRAVQAIIADLEAVGYAPYQHSFSYQGTLLYNVVADLPGRGYAPLPAEPLARLRDAIRAEAAVPELFASLEQEFGAGWAHSERLEELPRAQLVAELERRFGLGGWIPWWRDSESAPGFGAEIVIVGCHLDSTAQASAGFDPMTSPAPGADDDASGIACTLAAARALAGLRGMLAHTVRFCFFNAEEQGLLGSAAYANHLKSTGAPVKTVICVDTAGYDVQDGHSFEIHAGATDPAVRDASAIVAETTAKWAAATTGLGPAQIYRGTSSASLPDRALYDPAIGRADHASFQSQGIPAVVVSEDFFVNQAGEDAPEPNPNYHRYTDTTVNGDYVADIARAITRTVEELAQ